MFNSLFPYFSFILGICLGSFYNVCIYRYINNMSIIHPKSHCPNCKHELSWWENIPLISFLLLKGKCRICKNPISIRYPLVEFISGLWSLSLALKFGPSIMWIIFLFFGGIFIISSFIDLEMFILPDILILPGSLIAILVGIFYIYSNWKIPVLGALIGSGIFWIIQVSYKFIRKMEGLGTGDIKLMFMIGALVGYYKIISVIFIGSITALIASLYYMRKTSNGLKTMIPFGPFLCLGAMITILFTKPEFSSTLLLGF